MKKRLVIKLDTVFQISLLISLVTFFLDFSTSYFYFRHLLGFRETNFWVNLTGSFEVSLIPALLFVFITYLLIYLLAYSASVTTENRFVKYLTLAFFIFQPFLSFGAVIHNLFFVNLNFMTELALRYVIMLFCSVIFTKILMMRKLVEEKKD